MKRGKLYGIGIGPGDPKLLTLRAKEIIDQVDIIFCPKGREESTSWARSFVKEVALGPKKFVEILFPMTRNKETLSLSWQKAALTIANELRDGTNGAFVTLGDPFIYSTYIYLLKALQRNFPSIEVETIPGISSYQAAAARLQIPLAEGDERLAILPLTEEMESLGKVFQLFDTVVLMKAGSKLNKALTFLRGQRLLKHSVLVHRVGQPEERTVKGLSSLKTVDKEGYFSILIVKVPKRKRRP